jgi:ribosomal protein S4E
MSAQDPAAAVRAPLIAAGEETHEDDRDGADAQRLNQRGGQRVHPGDGTSRDMHENTVAEIHDYIVRRIPDIRVTSHYDFDREAQRFRIRHGRMVSHILLIEESAVTQYSRVDLNHLLDKAIGHLRLTAPEVQVRITTRGVVVEQVEH